MNAPAPRPRFVPAHALAALLLVLAGAAVAAAEPVRVDQLVRLAQAGIGEEVLEALVTTRGLADEVGPDEILELKEAGLSDSLIALLVAGGSSDTAGARAESRVEYEQRDGVLVVRGRGTAGEGGASGSSDGASAQPAPQQQVVVVPQAPAAASGRGETVVIGRDRDDEREEFAFPSGATFGYTGGAVFIPSRFGGASSFGRTVVFPPTDGFFDSVHHGRRGRRDLPTTRSGQPVYGVPTSGQPGERLIAIRTSRGPVYLPH